MPRSIRHSVSAALAVAAILASVVPAFAADAPVLTGTVVDGSGEPFPVESGLLEMAAPDGGGVHAVQVSVGGNGSFEVEVMPWGTATTPAEVTISITGAVSETVETAAGCIDQYAPVAEATFEVTLEDGGEPEPVALVAEERLIGSICGAGNSPGTTLPPSEVEPVTPRPSEPQAQVDPATPLPSEPPGAVPAVTTTATGVPAWVLAAVAVGAIAVMVLGTWLGLRRSRS